LAASVAAPPCRADDAVDFNRDIRPILTANCFACHGPDAAKRKADLRLDTREGATADLGDTRAIVPGAPAESEIVRRISTDDPSDRMPPPKSGKRLSAEQVRLLERWILEGAPYSAHWAYAPPSRPPLPDVRSRDWPHNAIDAFVLDRLERAKLLPSPDADRYAFVRRAALDLTGLPPQVGDADDFAADPAPDACERLVDRLLARPAFGEHWARMWLDLARYADSAGYADDPPRTIWAYRDYVIDSFNTDKPFDRFTVEQIAGDLLEAPSDEVLVATAFHRNTQTNNEGGTNDEEFRNVAVVDRVNTTMAAWMGTTMACAQCHNHKYDPISQEEYFRFFSFFNQTADADRSDESPVLALYDEAQKRRRAELEAEVSRLEEVLRTPTPELAASQARWEANLAPDLAWHALPPEALGSRQGAPWRRLDDGSVLVERAETTDVYELALPLRDADFSRGISAVRIETLPDASLPGGGPGWGGGNFVVTRLAARIVPPGTTRLAGRYVRVELPGKGRFLSLAEVQVFQGPENVATSGEANQQSTDYDGPAHLAIDGNTDGRYAEAKSTTHTEAADDPWWELDLKREHAIDQVVVWNRTDNDLHTRLRGFRLLVLDGERRSVWERTVAEPPNPSAAFSLSGARELPFSAAYADYSQAGFEAASVLGAKTKGGGWAVGGEVGKPHTLVLLTAAADGAAPGSTLVVRIEQLSKQENHTLGRLRVSASGDHRAGDIVRLPQRVLSIVRTDPAKRSDAETSEIVRYYLAEVAPELGNERQRLASLKSELAEIKPRTSVPILRELAGGALRTTRIQRRGNFLDLDREVTEGVPSTFHPLPDGARPDRFALARWLVDERNPLTARVTANRLWEKLFGIGLVSTSEEFGAQGDLPSHPELLDWLAVEVRGGGWRIKTLLRLLATSAAYRQSSRVTPELLERDADNRLISRGPRLRLPAEAVRDQALAVAGLLSTKMHGPAVRPPQPASGLNAAFGSGIDWQTSEGEDRWRRGLYTSWRRSNPYPSMTTFDAPNREVCTVRRASTNTPLQALVTLNDPVYVEAAQALARRMARAGQTTAETAAHGFRLVLARPPHDAEIQRLVGLYEEARRRLGAEPQKALALATVPLGALPNGMDPIDLAALTVVANVLLNLDEALMKR
jgi:hypothetical protein